jgi:hypothetical protein
MTSHTPRVVLLIAASLLLSGVSTSAQMFVTTGRDTLRGLPGVEVIVEPLQDELEGAGVSTAALRASVEARLRAAGITVFSSQEANTTEAKPYLYVHLNALEIPGQGLHVLAVQVQVRQTVRSLVRPSNIVDAMTWDSHSLVGARTKELPLVTEELLAHVDRFVRDWTATR